MRTWHHLMLSNSNILDDGCWWNRSVHHRTVSPALLDGNTSFRQTLCRVHISPDALFGARAPQSAAAPQVRAADLLNIGTILAFKGGDRGDFNR